MSNGRRHLRAWLNLLKASNAIKKSIDTELRKQFGISISRFDVLAALDRAPAEGMRAGALTQLLMVTEGNTTQVTTPLIRDGLVKRTVSTEDGRVAFFKLTRRGERLFKEMAAANKRWVGETFGALSENELATLRRLLEKLDIPALHNDEGKDAA